MRSSKPLSPETIEAMRTVLNKPSNRFMCIAGFISFCLYPNNCLKKIMADAERCHYPSNRTYFIENELGEMAIGGIVVLLGVAFLAACVLAGVYL